MKASRREYDFRPSVLGVHYIDSVTQTTKRDSRLVTKHEPTSSWWIVVGIVVLAAIGFSDVIF